MSAWLEAWLRNSRALHDKYGITISRQTDEVPQQHNQPAPQGNGRK